MRLRLSFSMSAAFSPSHPPPTNHSLALLLLTCWLSVVCLFCSSEFCSVAVLLTHVHAASALRLPSSFKLEHSPLVQNRCCVLLFDTILLGRLLFLARLNKSLVAELTYSSFTCCHVNNVVQILYNTRTVKSLVLNK